MVPVTAARDATIVHRWEEGGGDQKGMIGRRWGMNRVRQIAEGFPKGQDPLR